MEQSGSRASFLGLFDARNDASGRAIASLEWTIQDTQLVTHTTRTYFDALGRPYLTVRNLDPGYNVYLATPPACNRDAAGQVSPPYNICSQALYDLQNGRATGSLDPLGRASRSYFDALGRVVTTTRNLAGNAYASQPPAFDPATPTAT